MRGEYQAFIAAAYACVFLGLLYLTVRYTRLCQRLRKKFNGF